MPWASWRTLAQLGALAATLVEIHGQHEHQALLSRASQLDLLDAFGGLQPQLQAVRAAAQAWNALERERDALTRQGDVSERIGWLEHQLGELQRESLEPEAIAELTGSHRRHAHAAALISACDNAAARLGGDEAGSPSHLLQQVRADLARQVEHEPRLGEVDAMLDSAAIQLDEALALLDAVRSDLDLDPASFDDLDRRLARLHDLSRKHRVAPEGLAAQRDVLSAELEALRSAGVRLRQLEPQIQAALEHWREVASVLAAARAAAGARLSASTTALLSELGMGGGRFEVALEAIDSDRPDPNGTERTEFLVAARCRRGQARTTSTLMLMTACSSRHAAVGHAHEIVDHAVGQALETQRHGRAEQPAQRFEVQGQRDLACRLVQCVELPAPVQALERPVTQGHVDVVRRRQGVFGGEPGAQRTQAKIEPGDHPVRALLQHPRVLAPGKAARIGRHVVDQLEHAGGRMFDEGAALDDRHGDFGDNGHDEQEVRQG